MINEDGPPKIFEISSVKKEAEHIKTIFFTKKISMKAGQFFMVWIPGVDEKPFAVSYHNSKEFGITSHKIGKFTAAFDKLKKGDKVGLRGPYGNGFSLSKNSIVVSGGIGISSVSTLIDTLHNPRVLSGFRNKKFITYAKRFKKMQIATDDDSYGYHGFVTELLINEIKVKKPSVVYTCGPEIMMKKVLDICNRFNIKCQASVERYMKCGFGICGNCMCDDQIVCIDGPVFNSGQLSKMSEFGKFARFKTGKRVTLGEYAAWRS